MQERKFCDIKLFCGQPSTHVKNLNILSLILVITMFAIRQLSLDYQLFAVTFIVHLCTSIFLTQLCGHPL